MSGRPRESTELVGYGLVERCESGDGAPSRHRDAHNIRTIGKFGSFALVVNNISGPGMLDFPAAFQHGGYVPCCVCILGVAAVSAAVASMLCDVIARLEKAEDAALESSGASLRDGERCDPVDPCAPAELCEPCDAADAARGGELRGTVEFSGIFERLFGRAGYVGTQWLYFLNLFSQNVAAIVATAQACDMVISTIATRSVALRLGASDAGAAFVSWSAVRECGHSATSCRPFVFAEGPQQHGPLLTAGYVFCFVTLAPLGFVSLEENMTAQKLSFLLLLLLCACFLITWATDPSGESDATWTTVAAFGEAKRDVLGVVLFNFAFCVTVPPWLNEMRRDVDSRAVIWTSCLTSAILFIAVGWLGGRAYGAASDNVLQELTSPSATLFTRLCGGAFAFAIIGLGIPIFCIMMRHNLVSGRVCSSSLATFVSAALPWLVSWLVYEGHGILALLSWSGLVLNSLVDFILPMLAVLALLRRERDARPSSDDSRGVMGGIGQGAVPRPKPLIVQPLPTWLMPFYEPIARCVLVLVVACVGAGLTMKLAFRDETDVLVQ